MWRVRTVTSRCVQTNASCLACSGGIISSWIWLFRLVCALLPSSLIPSQRWSSGSSSPITSSSTSCTTSTIFCLLRPRVRPNVLTASSSPGLFFLAWAAPSSFKVRRSDHSPNLSGSRAQFHHSNSTVTTPKVSGHVAASPRVGGQEMV